MTERIVERKKETPSLAVSPLIPQMGSNSNILAEGGIDERKFAILPTMGVQMALYHFHHRGEHDGIRYFKGFTDWYLVTSQALEGKAREHVIRLTEAESGSAKPQLRQRPNWLSRNLWNRNWKDKADSRGEVIVQ